MWFSYKITYTYWDGTLTPLYYDADGESVDFSSGRWTNNTGDGEEIKLIMTKTCFSVYTFNETSGKLDNVIINKFPASYSIGDVKAYGPAEELTGGSTYADAGYVAVNISSYAAMADILSIVGLIVQLFPAIVTIAVLGAILEMLGKRG